MKATLDTIASNTGFAKSTVSRVLSGKADESRISEETIKKIKKEAEKCGYIANYVAKKMRSERTHTIGLVVPTISNPYFAELSSVIISEAQKYGYTTIVTDTNEDEETQNLSVASLLKGKVDGIIIVPAGNDPKFLEQTNEKYIPVILVDRYYENSTLPYIVTNNYRGGYEATMTLIRNGHKRIACIQGPPTTSNRKRVEGYLNALKDAQIGNEAIVVGDDFSIRNGYMETMLLLRDQAKRPTAIFAVSNTIGLGAFKAIKEAKMKIPDEISLITFDNYVYLDYLEPSITRLGQMVDEMGKMAVKLLMDSIISHKVVKSQIELAPGLILRESVAPILGSV